jgi:thioredoxin reductase
MNYEVVIIGGSYAGYSAALALGRALRQVLLLDAGQPCNASVLQVNNYIAHHNLTAGNFRAVAQQEIKAYSTVDILGQEAIAIRSEINGSFTVAINDAQFTTRRLLFATGVHDILPKVEGLQACWGKSVLHCPYCHGYEFAHKCIGILADGEAALVMAMNLQQWSNNLIIFSHEARQFGKEQLAQLRRNAISIVGAPLVAAQHVDGLLSGVVSSDGVAYKLQALFLKPLNLQRCEHLDALGCNINEQGLAEVDEWGATNVYGIYACGDSCNPTRTIALAIASGQKAAMGINRSLSHEQFYKL